jgi:hypothetical protein
MIPPQLAGSTSAIEVIHGSMRFQPAISSSQRNRPGPGLIETDHPGPGSRPKQDDGGP